MNRPTPTINAERLALTKLFAAGFRALLKAPIHAYRFAISPLLGPRCRHLPTCSEYALEALDRHGAWRGLKLAAWRLLRCHPWGTSGYDPVPPRERS